MLRVVIIPFNRILFSPWIQCLVLNEIPKKKLLEQKIKKETSIFILGFKSTVNPHSQTVKPLIPEICSNFVVIEINNHGKTKGRSIFIILEQFWYSSVHVHKFPAYMDGFSFEAQIYTNTHTHIQNNNPPNNM